MQRAIKVWIIVSIILIAWLVLKIYDISVSIKYEVDEPRTMFGDSDSLKEREQLLRNSITYHFISLIYLGINLIGCFIVHKVLKNQK